MQGINSAVEIFMTGIRTPAGIKFMYILTSVFNTVPFFFIFLCFAVLIYRKRGVLYSVLLLGSAALNSAFVLLLKHLTNVERPLSAVIVETDKSFPSGHAAMSTLFFGMLIYIFADRLKGFQKIAFNTFCIFMVTIICLSRLYLGVHWFTDIIGGIVVGSLVLFVSVKIFKKYDKFVW